MKALASNGRRKRRVRAGTKRARGFTLIELLVTLALVGLLASVAMPLYEVSATRQKESELREALRTIRAGLDAYKAASDSGFIAKTSGDSGYPPSLDSLTEVLVKAGTLDPAMATAAQRMVILRRLPRDPFATDPALPAADTWNQRAYATRSDDFSPGADVFDVVSKTTRTALDGTNYRDW